MKINVPLFESDNVCLGPIDHEKDPEIESNWTHDIQYLRQLSCDIARPLSPAHLKKKYEKIEKEMEEGKNVFYFTIRMRSDDRLIGFARLYWIEWSNGSGRIELGIGSEKDRQQGYGSEALQMLLRYAFAELNLYRLSADVPESAGPASGCPEFLNDASSLEVNSISRPSGSRIATRSRMALCRMTFPLPSGVAIFFPIFGNCFFSSL